MATVHIPDEVQTIAEAEAAERGFANASDYLTDLVRQDQRRRADEEVEAIVLSGIDSGDEVEMTTQAWREFRLELHRQAGIAWWGTQLPCMPGQGAI
jgi:antitoxin ParD1/3/4